MKIDVLTLFPEMFRGPFDESILKRARENERVEIRIHNLRDWAKDKHHTTDLPPYGGGPGMVMKVDVIDRAVEGLKNGSLQAAEGCRTTVSGQTGSEPPFADEEPYVVLLDTKGPLYNQRKAEELSKLDHLILIAGHYEGVDHRVHKHVADEVISIGEYVLTGGEIPIMVVVDSVIRLLPGVLGNAKSLEEESYSDSEIAEKSHSLNSVDPGSNTVPMRDFSDEKPSLEYPQYTRPEEYKGWKVPKTLLSGNHKAIEKWRKARQYSL